MTYAANGTSMRRNLPFLTPAEQELFMPSEAELLAIDRSYAIAKDSGALFAAQDRRALQQQINESGAA
jgi:hypothetical protein